MSVRRPYRDFDERYSLLETETGGRNGVRIHKIHAKNYRALEDITVDFASDYCAISGHNNAGKSCVIQLILYLLTTDDTPWKIGSSISYDDDKTQWNKSNDDIVVEYTLSINKKDDSALAAIIEKLSASTLPEGNIELFVKINVNKEDNRETHITANGVELDNVGRREFLKSLRTSNNLISHNSTDHPDEYFMGRRGPMVMYEFFLSQADRKSMAQAENAVQREAKKLAKDHKNRLSTMLGKLRDNFDVEFSLPELSYSSRRMPLAINLSDKSVEVPLTKWGSGTQNRTHVLLSILRASRIRATEAEDNRTTPIVLIEEPESFLHPSAQAEFGSVLQALASEVSIQIIVSTHSPYMLNQTKPNSNILLKRATRRGKVLGTYREATDNEDWMKPFADHLGIIPDEFAAWRDVIASGDRCLLLVEGDLDKRYVEFVREKFPSKFPVPGHTKVLPYGGKDALKNTAVIGFVKQLVPKLFITFDLDAKAEVENPLRQVGLEDRKDFLAIGKDKAGRRAIEGLLPDRVYQAVYGRDTELVTAASSENSKERRSARSALKQKLLQEFMSSTEYTDAELKDFEALGKTIAKALAG